ncbi:MAG: hypothetical protein QXU18_11240 [Thermoplasmatales archaeon]
MMKFILLRGDENQDNVFSLSVSNREGINRKTPSRAYKKVDETSNNQYFSEVFIPIASNDLQGQEGYDEFDKRIEQRVKKKEVDGNINIVSFFGDKDVDPEKIANFEDIGLLSKFEVLFNDHLMGMPYSFKFYGSGNFDEIYQKSTKIYETFSSVLEKKNLLGYVPAFVNYNALENYVNFYAGKNNGEVIAEGGERMNAIPLMIDFKRSNPDSYKRSVAKLRNLKLKYINEGFYPIYYAYNVSRPRMSKNKRTDIAKEFLLSFLGFDIIGATNAMLPRRGGGRKNKRVDFKIDSFTYYYTGDDVSSRRADQLKASIYGIQSNYLGHIHEKVKENKEYVKKEMESRKDANEYIKTMASP